MKTDPLSLALVKLHSNLYQFQKSIVVFHNYSKLKDAISLVFLPFFLPLNRLSPNLVTYIIPQESLQ